MTTICSFDCNQSALKSLIGDVKPMAPVDGNWMKVSARVFEDQVRKLAYGLMVKDYRRGETIVFTGCTDDETRLDQSIRYFRTTGEFAASSEIVSQVRYDPQFEDSFIGGQNYYQQLSVAAKGISMTNTTTYDSDIGRIFTTYMNQCAGGLKTPDQAVSDFKTSVSVAFPELIVE